MTRLTTTGRARLSRDAVLHRAVAFADEHGIDALSMRSLADALGVVPMALYKHVLNKQALLDGMVDVVITEIGATQNGAAQIGPAARTASTRWRAAVRARILAARATVQRHPWARRVIETRTARSPVVLQYLDSISALFLAGGLSADLTHHAMHAIGSRVWGFTQDVFDTDAPSVPMDPAVVAELAARLPSLAAVAGAVRHDTASAVGYGCDDQFEFEFALDMLLGGIERHHRAGWTSTR